MADSSRAFADRIDAAPDRVIIYKAGLFCASACAPSDMTGEQVAEAAEAESPAGTSNGWMLSTDTTFRGGEPMPCPCETHPDTRRHWLLEA